jgi:hypothetical protein
MLHLASQCPCCCHSSANSCRGFISDTSPLSLPPPLALPPNCCRDIQFQADPKPCKQRPYAERETPKGAFGNLYPQAVPSTPDSKAVKDLG